MGVIYNLGILIYSLLARLLAPFNTKAKLWINGRTDWELRLKNNIIPGEKYIWFHCASLGEFEQGRPVIEKFKREKPEYKILLTFYSPSGYEIRKDYEFADYVCYLPADTPGNAEKFISIVKPAYVVFVKYEFWYNYIAAIAGRKIPLYLISGNFRSGQHFFRWYGAFFRKMLFRFSHIFAQDELSLTLLRGIGIVNVSIAGDTRFDRVAEIAAEAVDIPQIDLFRGGEKLFIAGSSWHRDEEIISEYINRYPGKMKWVFAPHEIDKPNIDRLEKIFSTEVVRFSEFTQAAAVVRVMIIDNIGMLSSAYRYAHIAEVGGGFDTGIHNVLEAACWEIPVMFGPDYEDYREAVDLIKLNGAGCFRNYEEFSKGLDNWLENNELYYHSAKVAGDYVKQNTGATGKIFTEITQKDMNKSR